MDKRISTTLGFLFILIRLCLGQTPYGPEFNGLKLAKDSSKKFVLVNINNVVILPIDSINIESDKIIQKIDSSSLQDKMLIVRILKKYTDPKKKLNELMALTQTYDAIALFMLKEVDEKLKVKFSKRKLKKMKKKKNKIP